MSIVSPTILNGNSSNQRMGYRKRTASASGQQITNKTHQRSKLRNRFINDFFYKQLQMLPSATTQNGCQFFKDF